MKKKILVDLSILKNPHCGLGQIALNYGKYFMENIDGNEDFDLYILVPKKFIGKFGSKVKYLKNKTIYKLLPFLLPKFDLWHSIHQLNKFKPYYANTKHLVTIHDLNFLYEKKGKKIEKYTQRIQKEIKRANQITCISEFTKQELINKLLIQEDRIKVIYNGVENLTLKKDCHPQGININKEFFFSMGVMKNKKNFHTLLDLMKLYPQYNLYLAGNDKGTYAEMIKKRIINESISNVKVLGIISEEEKVWLYKHCKAFLFPSLFEGFGLPVIEAMQFGKPVFSSKETSLKEIGNDHAYFWDSFEAIKMKTVIDSNLSNFCSSENLQNASIEYAKTYTYDKHLASYFTLYQKMLS